MNLRQRERDIQRKVRWMNFWRRPGISPIMCQAEFLETSILFTKDPQGIFGIHIPPGTYPDRLERP